MSYRFCYGPSGCGKSFELQREIAGRSDEALRRFAAGEGMKNFLYIVPEQFTMQTQKELVNASMSGGIMNVDVLSFGRLAHRIFEEVGRRPRTSLDDIGKNLILMRAAKQCAPSLKVLGGRIGRLDMISEIKSVISEFMQYGLEPEDVTQLIGYAREKRHPDLAARLEDLQVLYSAFREYESDRFITGEETLDELADAIAYSELIRGSIVVFDGFTGFTPVQYRVLQALMKRAAEVIFCFTIGEDGSIPPQALVNAKAPLNEQALFYLTRKTMRDIAAIAAKSRVPRGNDIIPGRNAEKSEEYLPGRKAPGSGSEASYHVPGRNAGKIEAFLPDIKAPGSGSEAPYRFLRSPVLAHLEKALLRYPLHPYKGENDGALEIIPAPSVTEEIRSMCIRIRTLVREQGYCYRDFACVTGDLSGYADEIRRLCALYDIPVYIDMTRRILMNPLTEAVRSALRIAAGDYSYQIMFRFLRSGLAPMEPEEIDLLENYCLAHGVTTKKRWESAFDEENEKTRLRVLEILRPLTGLRGQSAAGRTEALYQFLLGTGAEAKMQAMAADFEKEGDVVRQKEYEQVYRAVIDLMDQIHALVGEEKISAADYLELMEAGFSEIRLGTLPQRVDRMLAGDIERTRLSEVKVLFFLGVNDGNIPRSAGGGGLLSDLDREMLGEGGFELAPTPRQELYIQRFYLYLNMTKPTDRLIVSYAAAGPDGTSLRPSYLIEHLERLFPGAGQRQEQAQTKERLVGIRDTMGYLARALRDYADGRYDEPVQEEDGARSTKRCEQRNILFTVYSLAAEIDPDRTGRLMHAAFLRYRPELLRPETAQRLYGNVLKASVTRLESAAQCGLRQYLQWGLHLRERDEFVYTSADSGTILHNGILLFSEKIRRRGLDWQSFDRELGRKLAQEAVLESAGTWHDQLLYADARTAYNVRRLTRIMERTVDTLQFQARQGNFVPYGYELPFSESAGLVYPLANGRLELIGRIDRLDICRTEDGVLAKIVDYKSGSRDLDEKEIRRGFQLQLMMYMEAALGILAKKFPGQEITPAALLYYHFDDPVLTGKDAVLPADPGQEAPQADVKRLQAVRRALRPRGMVNSEESVILNLDRDFTSDSLVIPVGRLKDGSQFTKNSHIFDAAGYSDLRLAVGEKITGLGEEILRGGMEANPAVLGPQRTACTFCPFGESCGFDRKTPGYTYRQ